MTGRHALFETWKNQLSPQQSLLPAGAAVAVGATTDLPDAGKA